MVPNRQGNRLYKTIADFSHGHNHATNNVDAKKEKEKKENVGQGMRRSVTMMEKVGMSHNAKKKTFKSTQAFDKQSQFNLADFSGA
jgi:UDP-glucose 4-epimerase